MENIKTVGALLGLPLLTKNAPSVSMLSLIFKNATKSQIRLRVVSRHTKLFLGTQKSHITIIVKNARYLSSVASPQRLYATTHML